MSDLLRKEKMYSLVIIELYDNDSQPYKLLETDDLKKDVPEILKEMTFDQYLLIYNKEGLSIKLNNL